MAHTNTWDETDPAATGQLSSGDDAIRQLKLDIRERMNDILDTGGKWTDDPIALDLSATGIRTGVVLYYGPTMFRTISNEDFNITDLYYESDDESNKYIYLDLNIPVGAKIQSVNAMVSRTGSNTITLYLYRRAYDTTPALALMDSTISSRVISYLCRACGFIRI